MSLRCASAFGPADATLDDKVWPRHGQ